jgi:hypothetical protein
MAGENLQDGQETANTANRATTLQDTENQLASRRRTATDAEMLIEHASRCGVLIDDAMMQRILQWIQKIRSGELITIEDDVAFWRAYQSINAAVLPANVYSIRERLDFDDTDKKSQLELASSNSRRGLILILVLTLIVHCYFAVLQTLISDAQTAQTAFANAKIPLAATDNPSSSSLEAAAEQLRAASCIWHSNLELLGYWLFVDDVLHFIGRIESLGSNAAAPPDESGACTLPVDTNRNALLSVPLEPRDKLANDAALLTRAISTRNAFSQFVLPLLYGWLGALAYGLRTFASEMRSVTFSRATHIEQKMRIPLGILAGATVGLLIQPETLNTIQGVTSIGIAFGLGFSVDLFFDLMEGLMARLRGTSVAQAASPIVSPPPPPPPSPAQAASPPPSPAQAASPSPPDQ